MIQYKGGDGSSEQEAVIILGAENELEGVDAEFEFIQRLYSDYELDNQPSSAKKIINMIY